MTHSYNLDFANNKMVEIDNGSSRALVGLVEALKMESMRWTMQMRTWASSQKQSMMTPFVADKQYRLVMKRLWRRLTSMEKSIQ
jgi:hypothetical protein